MFRRPTAIDTRPASRWPLEFDPVVYARHPTNRDLARMNPGQAAEHYRKHGRREGRVCSAVASREQLLSLIAPGARILEIGPFYSPMFDKARCRVSYVDVLNTEQLRARAATVVGGVPETVPEIDYVWTGGPIAELIDERFDVVFSSHNIEHQPCLISHLADLAALLKPGGAVFLFVPDRRYCFDHFLPPTGLTEVLGAWFEPTARHTGEAVVKHWMFLTHNDASRHWAGDHGENPFERPADHALGAWMRSVRDTYRAATDYVDVHAWQFDPESFRGLLQHLHDSGLSELAPVRVYPTVTGALEFYAIIQPD